MKRIALAFLAAVAAAPPVGAIPAFARRYGMTCASCHDPVPRLNAFGNRFAAQGYQLVAGDTTGMTSLGDPLLRMSNAFPVAVRFDAYARYVTGTGGYTDFATPWVTKLLSGGQVADGVSYYIYFLLSERGVTGPVEDAWLMFSEPAGVPVDVTVGQFQIADPIWKRELRLTLEDYAILSFRRDSAAARLTYDRGLIVGWSPREGTNLFGEVVNGNGIGESSAGRFDGDRPKAYALLGTHALGPLTVGFIGYYGHQDLAPTGGGPTSTNRTRMIGPSLTAAHGNLEFGGQWLYRDDTDPGFTGAPARVVTRGGFAEVAWWPMGRQQRWVVAGLYNVIDTEAAPNYQTLTGTLGWLLARNVRLSGEVTWDTEADRASIGLGVVSAF